MGITKKLIRTSWCSSSYFASDRDICMLPTDYRDIRDRDRCTLQKLYLKRTKAGVSGCQGFLPKRAKKNQRRRN